MPPPNAAESTLIANLRLSSLATDGTPRNRCACSVLRLMIPIFVLLTCDLEPERSWLERLVIFSSRKFYGLEMERKSITYLALNWTVVHPIDDKSPIYGYTLQDLEEADAEFLVMIKAYDESFSAQVHSRQSYKAKEIIWGAKFLPMFFEDNQYGAILKLQQINATEKVQLPVTSVSLDEMMKEN